MQGVTITLTTTGSTSPATVTDANGHYSFTGLTNGQFTLTPSISGSTFTPASLTVTISGSDLTGKDFGAVATPTGYSISGVVTASTPTGPGVSGVTMTLSGTNLSTSITTTSDTSGNYTFSGLPNGTYTLTLSKSSTRVVCIGPSQPNGMTVKDTYTFTPASLDILINGTSSTDMNFEGTVVPWRGSCPV
jgi:hypothetical protein